MIIIKHKMKTKPFRNTQGLEIIEEKGAAFALTWLDFGIFSDKDVKP